MKTFIKRYKIFFTIVVLSVIFLCLLFLGYSYFHTTIRLLRSGIDSSGYTGNMTYDELHRTVENEQYILCLPYSSGEKQEIIDITGEEHKLLESILRKYSYSRIYTALFPDGNVYDWESSARVELAFDIHPYYQENGDLLELRTPGVMINKNSVVLAFNLSTNDYLIGTTHVLAEDGETIIEMSIYDWYILYYGCDSEELITEVWDWVEDVKNAHCQ